LTPQQLQQLDAILQGVDLNAGGAPESTALQEGGSTPTPRSLGRADPAQDRRRQARDTPPYFRGQPTTAGKGPVDNRQGEFDASRIRREPSGMAHDSIAEDRELRRRLRLAGHPLGAHGAPGTALRYANACGLGHLAMDSAAPYRAPVDADAGVQAAMRIGSLSYAGGRIVHEEAPRAQAMAYDSTSDPLSLGAMMPGLAARFALQEDRERRAFAVAPKEGADDRSPGRRSRAANAMAFDSRSAGRNAAPSIAQVYGPELANRLNAIGYVR